MNTAQVSEVKTCILYTAQVPEGAKSYPFKRKHYTAQVYSSSFRGTARILYAAQVPEGVNLYCSKRNNYAAQVSEVIPFKKEKYTAQVSEVKCL